MKRFYYFNASLNLCAEEEYVIDSLIFNGITSLCRHAISEILRTLANTGLEFNGWKSCDVSETIDEAMRNAEEEG